MIGRVVPRALVLLFIAPLSGCGARSELFVGEAPDGGLAVDAGVSDPSDAVSPSVPKAPEGAPSAETWDSSREDVVSSNEAGLDACSPGITACGADACIPNCTDQACGAADGCGATCTRGSCPTGTTCVAGQCSTVPSHAIVLFGGTSFVGDTWEWDGSAWTQHNVPGPSTPRLSCAMATLGAKALLFGGNNPNELGDTWEWDGSGWTRRNVSGPSARSVHAMAMGRKLVDAAERASARTPLPPRDGRKMTPPVCVACRRALEQRDQKLVRSTT